MLFKNKNFQKLHRLHRWLGLILSVHIMLLAITGAVLVFHDELSPAGQSTSSSTEAVPLQTLVDKSLQEFPTDRLLAIGIDDEDSQKVSLRLGKDGSRLFRGARRLHFDRSTGEALTQERPDSGFLHTILVLHRELFLGTWGKLYVGILGLAYAFVLITGLFIYGPMMKRMRFGSIRAHLHPRQWWADIHKFFGAMTFGWSLVVGLTGFLLGWGGPIIKFYQGSALKGLTAEFSGPQEDRPFVSIDEALATAVAAKPDGRFSFVAFPDSEFSTAHHYIFVMEGQTPLTQKLSDLVVVNAYDARLERVLILPWYLQLLLLSEPLHFGDYGGLVMKVLWVIFGLFSMVLPLSGLRIFLQKFRKERAEKRRSSSAARMEASTGNRPYSLPLILMGLSWTGLILALFLEGIEDGWANLLLASVLILSIWFLRRNKRAVSSE